VIGFLWTSVISGIELCTCADYIINTYHHCAACVTSPGPCSSLCWLTCVKRGQLSTCSVLATLCQTWAAVNMLCAGYLVSKVGSCQHALCWLPCVKQGPLLSVLFATSALTSRHHFCEAARQAMVWLPPTMSGSRIPCLNSTCCLTGKPL